MLFKKGDNKPVNSGRKKGTPNKKKVLRVSDVLNDREIDPTAKLVEIAEKLEMKDDLKEAGKIWIELLSYTQGKPKDDQEPDEVIGDESMSNADILNLIRDVTPKAVTDE